MRKHGFTPLNKLLDLAMGYRRSKPLLVALHYDLFSHVEDGCHTVAALRHRLSVDERALRLLLEALVALDLLSRRGERYVNRQATRRFLVSRSPEYVGNNLKYQEQTWEAWSDLRNILKSGRPNFGLIDWIRRDAFTEDYIRAMGDVARWPAKDLASKLDLRGVRRLLDVGCGSGAYSAAIVERDPRVEATLLDLPSTLSVTRRLLSGHPHADRFKFLERDFLARDFGVDAYDLVLISNVTHVEDAANNRALVSKAFRALRRGGKLVIHDYVAQPGRAGRKWTAMLGLHLLVFTGRGNVYTLSEYSDWLHEARFRDISHTPVAQGSLSASTAIVGRKR